MDKGDLNKLFQNGLISSKPYQYFEIKSKVNQYLGQGITKTEAVRKTSQLVGVSIPTVWNALKATNGINLT